MSPRHLQRCSSIALVLGSVLTAVACAAEPSPATTVRAFLLNWQNGDYEAAASHTNGDPEEVANALHRFHDELDIAALRLGLAPIDREGESATAAFQAQVDLGIGDPVWSFEGSMDLRRVDGEWLVDWTPSVIHPDLAEGERLAVTYDVPERGQIFDRAEDPLVAESEVVAFGVHPAEMSDIDADIAELAELLGERPGPFLDRVRSAPPDAFQPLVLMRAQDADTRLLNQAERISGVTTVEMTMPLAPAVAPAVIGEVAGTHDRDVAGRVSGPYQAGDTVGLSALQSVYQQRLAGTATTKVVTLDEAGEESGVLEEWSGAPSGTLQTTLDTTVQEAAEGALATEPLTTHLVALDVETSEVLAAASHPADPDNNGSLAGEYLPGNAFTIISTAAMLDVGAVTPEQAVACEPERAVDGHTFVNRSGQQLWGEPEFTSSFAHSCTNAFVELASSITEEDLARSAADFGIGTDWRLPISTYPGEFPELEGAGDLAASTVGEHEDLRVSPLGMALVAAAVADGTWHAPRLVVDTDTEEETPDDVELPEETVRVLRELMRATVEQGSATRANVGTIPVHGQVGVVEQEIDGENRVVQWFVGFQGNLAFAVATELVSEVQHQYAVGFAADFLQRLPHDYVRLTERQQEEMDAEVPASTGW